MTVLSPRPRRFVVTSLSSDAHMWNLVFLQLFLEELGGEVINLGACTPDELIIAECRKAKPDVLVVSTVNGHGHIDGNRLIRKVRQDTELAGMYAVIGGKLGVGGDSNTQFSAELISAGFDATFEATAGLDEFVCFLESLTPGPARRRMPRRRMLSARTLSTS
jgi:methylaspartate mutase sigma subunit